jgi:hypothetical protein
MYFCSRHQNTVAEDRFFASDATLAQIGDGFPLLSTSTKAAIAIESFV